ncbi:MAG: fasciclin domain-containing protein [Bacteroidaceae bacterium]|nr:fasciclin domain-containing protein [Bacteroidaceae bacterium]
MKKAISKKLKSWMLLPLAIFAGGTFIGCQEEVDQSNRFTFTGELISTHLEKHPEKYSHFVEILSKASIGNKASGSMLKTLSTYGAYTCIAPTNQAVEKFVTEQYEIYANSVAENENNPLAPIIETGITSPNVSDLSVEKCTEIARNHIIEDEFRTVDFKVGSNLPKVTMNYRPVLVNSNIDEETGDRVYYLGINEAPIEESDISTYNGTIHSISEMLNPSTQNASEIINEVGGISIFREALQQTGLTALLNKFDVDKDYDKDADFSPFTTEPADKQARPEINNYGFTLLIEPNEILANPENNSFNMSITSLDDLIEFAELVYGSEPGYENNYTHPKNALFKYVSYHIIDRKLDFVSGPGGWMMELDYENPATQYKAETNVTDGYNWHDYFETYLPYDEWEYTDADLEEIAKGNVDEGCMIKVTKAYKDPAYKKSDIVLNYCNTTPSDMMYYHTNIKVIRQLDAQKIFESLKGVSLDPQNATIHYLDKILVYNEQEMRENIINERMRMDAISCFPELTTNLVRWNIDYNCTYIPIGSNLSASEKQYSKRLYALNNDSRAYYLFPFKPELRGYCNFQGDELLFEGNFNIKYRLPHVPKGTYEVRFGFSMSDMRGVIQFYLDEVICGIPVDMRNDEANINRIGWFDDFAVKNDGTKGDRLTEAEIQDSEKALRNRGYMKAPASILVGNKEPMRQSDYAMRRILVTNQELGPDPERKGHWVRIKNVTEGSTGKEQYNQDYLEIVPKSIYNNPAKPEDRD